MPTPRDNLPFPLDLGLLGPVQVVANLSAAEIGALVLLARAAWTEDPRDGLSPREEHLARLCGRMDGAAWTDVREAVFLCWQPGQDGRLHNAALEEAYSLAADRSRRLSQAGRAAAGKRWSGCEPDASRMRFASDPHPPRIGPSAGPLRAKILPERPCPALLPEQEIHLSALSAPGASIQMPSGRSAEARAPERSGESPLQHQLRLSERRVVHELLRSASWPWAGKRHRQVPVRVVEQLIDHPNARVRQVEWALAWAARLQFEPDNLAKYNPVGRVIAAIERDIQPDLWWSEAYDRRADSHHRRFEQLRAFAAKKPAAPQAAVGGGG